ncbi:S-adenosylmethionine decarboxylase proenzyme-like [Amphiura filiformis]|uniref:S-adenosylmethionine decarboxylase proenzyme-like n=1 Tax=Amphiura filiformis TaxID=82378 RepID=UPI003B20DCDC
MAQATDSSSNGGSKLTSTHYEGTEKLLEVWFGPVQGGTKKDTHDLRNIPRDNLIDKILTPVRCEIVSVSSNEDQTAYVLSESSMFISKRRFILKTCGTTTLLKAIEPLMKLAKDFCEYKVLDIFYSRKNFFRPELQDTPHRTFDNEVAYLDSLFEGGAAYVLGRVNGECWYLYTLDCPSAVMEPDQTLEILMTHLDESTMSLFQNTTGRNVKDTTRESGIATLLPDCDINDFLFEPCGYSMNGLLPNNGYMTIHITPEKEFSYVSFETNAEMENYGELVKRVVSTFNPGRFCLTLFTNKAAKCGSSLDALKEVLLKEYNRQDRQFSEFSNYDLTFAHYIREKRP